MNQRFLDLRQQARIAAGIMDRKIYAGPWTVQIDLTNRCNNDCIACWCNSPLLGDKGMPADIREATLPYEKLVELIDELSALGVRSIYFTGGGEPFMHPRIMDVMRYIKGKGIHLDMSTNFTLVDKDIAREISDLRVDHMNLSLWAGSGDVYARQHPNKNEETFNRMTEVIDHIGDLKKKNRQTVPGLGMYNVINVHNYQDIFNMLDFAFRHRMDHVHFTHVDTVPERTEELALNSDQLAELLTAARKVPCWSQELGDKYGHRLFVIGFDTFRERIESNEASQGNYDSELLARMPSCYAGWSFARVLANGDVNSCLKSFKIPVGNIHENSFTDIWFGEKEQEFRGHTIDYDPSDPYFLEMGNDMATDGQGCHKCCDNLGLNLSIQGRLDKLGWGMKKTLKVLRRL